MPTRNSPNTLEQFLSDSWVHTPAACNQRSMHQSPPHPPPPPQAAGGMPPTTWPPPSPLQQPTQPSQTPSQAWDGLAVSSACSAAGHSPATTPYCCVPCSTTTGRGTNDTHTWQGRSTVRPPSQAAPAYPVLSAQRTQQMHCDKMS